MRRCAGHILETATWYGGFGRALAPNITGTFKGTGSSTSFSGAFYNDEGGNFAIGGFNGSGTIGYAFEANRSNAAFGKATTVQPASLRTLVLIKS